MVNGGASVNDSSAAPPSPRRAASAGAEREPGASTRALSSRHSKGLCARHTVHEELHVSRPVRPHLPRGARGECPPRRQHPARGSSACARAHAQALSLARSHRVARRLGCGERLERLAQHEDQYRTHGLPLVAAARGAARACASRAAPRHSRRGAERAAPARRAPDSAGGGGVGHHGAQLGRHRARLRRRAAAAPAAGQRVRTWRATLGRQRGEVWGCAWRRGHAATAAAVRHAPATQARRRVTHVMLTVFTATSASAASLPDQATFSRAP